VVRKEHRQIRIERPTIRTSEEEQLWRDVVKFAKLAAYEPEPNLGRVVEIKEEIREGTYLNPEVIEETAARIAIRFLKKE
jgi:hypothetical protein